MISKILGFFEKSKNNRLILCVFYGLCACLVIVDLSVHRHIQHDWEKLPAFYAIFGFVVCVALVLIAKLLRKVIMRKQDYYDA